MSAALARAVGQATPTEKLKLAREDLHRQLRRQQPRRLTVFLIDASDSMGDSPDERMAATLGAALSLASDAYLNRDQVCLITFRDRAARVLVPPTDSVAMLRKHLQRLPVGGATPLAAGLRQARQVIRQAHLRDPQQRPLLVLISDGEATVPLQPDSDPVSDALSEAHRLRQEGLQVLLITADTTGRGAGIMPQLAEILGTDCHRLHALQAGRMLELIERTRANHRK